MTTANNPKVNITKLPAEQEISTSPQRVLIVGQQTGSTYTSGSLVTEISNANTEIVNIGRGSQLAEMIRAFKSINQETVVDVIPLDDDGSGVNATGEVAFSGTASGSGVFVISIGSRDYHKYTITVESGDTATEIGTKLVTAITADSDKIVTGSNTTGTVTLTAVNAGTCGNGIGIEVVGTVAGVTPSVTAMSSGATDPTITNLFNVVGDQRYQTVIFPSNLDTTIVATSDTSTTSFLDPRWNATNSILDGVCVTAKTDTLANIKTFLNNQNSQSLIVACQETVNDTLYKGSSIFELNEVIAAKIGAVRALGLTNGADNSSVIVANNLDSIGGAHIASLPYMNRAVFLPIIDIGKGWTASEIEEINDAGGFIVGNNINRTKTVLGQVYTTYKTDSSGNADQTYQYLNSVDIASTASEFLYNNLKSVFSQYRLTDGSVYSDRNIINLNGIKSKLTEYYVTLSGEDYLLYRDGADNIKYFVDNLTLSIDMLTGSVSGSAKAPLVSQLRSLDLKLQAVFNI